MKRIISIIIALITVLSMSALSACNNTTGEGGKPDGSSAPASSTAEAPESDIKSSVDFMKKVWGAIPEDKRFPAAGGDVDHSVDGAPGKFNMTAENADTLKWWLHLTDDLFAMLGDDVATLQHMMNTNTFCSAMAKLKDPSKAAGFAEGFKTALQEQHWMCGFPDTLIVISLGDYLIMAYGNSEIIEDFKAACSKADASAKLLVEAPVIPA